ncbi:hypothetical protein [Altericroceibacterium endophyticum]|uniref:Uncharacterized protein n=1 Tax=Altericroceibacterium endophyticum TaxID=1808508 RepID=A0A6I4T776_9SPHN|nr:hypothetical protein [Altericroceibacterium endophyticum]MXO65961.1 hypothetical protein [Altericroceibacterium endophyticum]
MNVQSFSEQVSRVRMRIFQVLMRAIGAGNAVPAAWELPAGSLLLAERKLIFASTPCDPALFRRSMHEAATATGADVVLAHQPYAFGPQPTYFSVVLNMNGELIRIDEMLLYFERSSGFWLVPSGHGPFVALERTGLRLDFEPPFVTFQQRCACIEAASAALAGDNQMREAA